ncbi:MAG: metallophosphoesterase [Deltaproteobacteria bacterium]|nr:metallophosphoesterase [Deltaproteobacteria bacterium]
MRALILALVTALGNSACSGCYHLPEWEGDVHVTPIERKAGKLCGTGGVTEDGKQRITREPYIQMTTLTSSTVAWGTTDARGEVVLSEPGGEPIRRVAGEYVGDPSRESRRKAAQGVAGEDSAENIYVVAAKLAGLEPNHLYCYQVMIDGVALTDPAPLSTATPPGLEEPLKFIAVGDTGTGGPAQQAILKRMTESPFDFVLVLGDLAYESGTAAQLQGKFFSIYKEVLRYAPIYPAIGNHERRTREGQPYFEAFVLPEPERYYSFDWGDVHFVAIDTTQRDTEQLVWLDKDLKQNKQPWVIVFGHHPMYTNSLRGPQLWIRQAFSKILTDNKVDLVLTGHEHQYERFRVAGVNFVVSGGGGGQLTKFFGEDRALKQATKHHFLAFEATAAELKMKVVDINGREIETLALTKDRPNQEPKVEVDGKPETTETPIAPETKVKPDEKLHDEPDDDKTKVKVPPPPDEPTPLPAKTTDATPDLKPAAVEKAVAKQKKRAATKAEKPTPGPTH